jgi:YD repeat-containing protein
LRTNLYVILLFACQVPVLTDAQHVIYPDTKDIRGNARSMRQVVFALTEKAGKAEKGEQVSKVQYLFGQKKNLVERDAYDADGDILERYATNFDANGNMVEETEYNSDSLQNKYTYRYDNKGNMIGWMSYAVTDTEVARGSYAYDDKGRILADSMFDAKGRQVEWHTYSYDEDNHLAKRAHFTAHGEKVVDNYVYDMDGDKIQDTRTGFDGSTISVSRYKYYDGKLTQEDILTDSTTDYVPAEKIRYDAKGNKTEDDRYRGGVAAGKETYKYDDAANMIEDARYRTDGSLDLKFTWKYDASKNKTEYAIYKSDTAVFERWTYQYDAQGNKTEECFYKAQTDGPVKLVREYDKNGNWVRQTGFSADTPFTLTEREIVYYQ